MGEIADDHYVALSWSEGVGVGGDCGNAPPCDHPAYGGIDSWIANRIRTPRSIHTCKFCGNEISFKDRKPINLNGSDHRCLAERRRAP